MEIYEIKNLDCSKKENRKRLLSEVITMLDLEIKPSKDDLKGYCKRIKRKHNIKLRVFELDDGLQLNIEVDRGIYSTMKCNSIYEAMCKYILFCKQWIKYKKMQERR